MVTTEFIKLPRLYVDGELSGNAVISLAESQAHYLRNVLRRGEGDRVRLFNGRDGEWLCALTRLDKKAAQAQPQDLLVPQPAPRTPLHLMFAPIKKARMDMLVEKAAELGATHLHPVLTQNTEVRQINEDRIRAQLTEAAEQCERLDIPRLLPLKQFETAIGDWDVSLPLAACLERRRDILPPCAVREQGLCAFLIGPEGGFTEEERDLLERQPFVKPLSLGDTVLRAETAALACLALSLT